MDLGLSQEITEKLEGFRQWDDRIRSVICERALVANGEWLGGQCQWVWGDQLEAPVSVQEKGDMAYNRTLDTSGNGKTWETLWGRRGSMSLSIRCGEWVITMTPGSDLGKVTPKVAV